MRAHPISRCRWVRFHPARDDLAVVAARRTIAVHTEALQLLALAAAILALGSVYWLVRDEDRREPV